MRQAAKTALLLCIVPTAFFGCASHVTMKEAELRGRAARSWLSEFYGEPAPKDYFVKAGAANRRGGMPLREATTPQRTSTSLRYPLSDSLPGRAGPSHRAWSSVSPVG
jgi:hypothetical protein